MHKQFNSHNQSLRKIGPTHSDGRKVGTVLIAGNDGNWWMARPEQVEAYIFLFGKGMSEGSYKFDLPGGHINVRSRMYIPDGPYVHSHAHIFEMQDRARNGVWRQINELEKAPTPKRL